MFKIKKCNEAKFRFKKCTKRKENVLTRRKIVYLYFLLRVCELFKNYFLIRFLLLTSYEVERKSNHFLQGLLEASFKGKIHIKGTVIVFSNDPLCKDDNAIFTTVPL